MNTELAKVLIKKYEVQMQEAKAAMGRARALKKLIRAEEIMLRRGWDVGGQINFRINQVIENGTVEDILREAEYVKSVGKKVDDKIQVPLAALGE